MSSSLASSSPVSKFFAQLLSLLAGTWPSVYSQSSSSEPTRRSPKNLEYLIHKGKGVIGQRGKEGPLPAKGHPRRTLFTELMVTLSPGPSIAL